MFGKERVDKDSKIAKYLYLIRDILGEENAPSFEAKNDEVARRMVWRLLKTVVPYDRPSFILLRIGSFEKNNNEKFGFSFNTEIKEIDIDMPKFIESNSQGLLDLEKTNERGDSNA